MLDISMIKMDNKLCVLFYFFPLLTIIKQSLIYYPNSGDVKSWFPDPWYIILNYGIIDDLNLAHIGTSEMYTMHTHYITKSISFVVIGY